MDRKRILSELNGHVYLCENMLGRFAMWDSEKAVNACDFVYDHVKDSFYYHVLHSAHDLDNHDDFVEFLKLTLEEQKEKLNAETQALSTTNRKQYDVFISHASSDKENYVDELNGEIKKLGVKIFYDGDVIKWGDNWKEKILTGIEQAEFAIIVISENFFGREWTEKELNDFLTRQNESGQKIVLPILHNVSVGQMKEKYPKLSEIQAIEAGNYKSAESIAVLFAGQLIERFR